MKLILDTHWTHKYIRLRTELMKALPHEMRYISVKLCKLCQADIYARLGDQYTELSHAYPDLPLGPLFGFSIHTVGSNDDCFECNIIGGEVTK
jgi:hypothetical protein